MIVVLLGMKSRINITLSKLYVVKQGQYVVSPYPLLVMFFVKTASFRLRVQTKGNPSTSVWIALL